MSAAVPTSHLELQLSWGLPRISTGFWGQRWFAATISLPCDALSEAGALAVRAGYLYDTLPQPPDLGYEQPPLAIELLGRDAGLPLYQGELAASLLAQLRRKWALAVSGPRAAMLSELERAGYTGVQIANPTERAPGDSHADFWARFWIIFPAGTHRAVLADAPVVGTCVVGACRVGPFASADDARWYKQLQSIVARTRPAQWVPWDFVFELDGGPPDEIRLLGHKRFADPDYSFAI